MIGSIVVVALMTVLSILLISGKALNMVPGYRSLPDKVKKTLDPKKVGRKLGIPMLIVDIVMVIFFLIVFLSDSEKLQKLRKLLQLQRERKSSACQCPPSISENAVYTTYPVNIAMHSQAAPKIMNCDAIDTYVLISIISSL